MRLIMRNEGTYYEAKNHFGIWGIKKLADGEAKNLSISISEFLPNGGALMTASEKDRVYMVLRGTMDVNGEDGSFYPMERGDMIFIPAGEKREIKVIGGTACRILVIIVNAA